MIIDPSTITFYYYPDFEIPNWYIYVCNKLRCGRYRKNKLGGCEITIILLVPLLVVIVETMLILVLE